MNERNKHKKRVGVGSVLGWVTTGLRGLYIETVSGSNIDIGTIENIDVLLPMSMFLTCIDVFVSMFGNRCFCFFSSLIGHIWNFFFSNLRVWCVTMNTIHANCKLIFGPHYCDYIFLYQINKWNWWGSVQWPKRCKTKICTSII